MRSGKRQRAKTALEKRASSLTRRVWQKEAAERLDETRLVEQRSDLRADVAAHGGAGGGDVVHDLRTPIDHGDDVLEIMTRDDVTTAASMERSNFVAMNSAGVTTRTSCPAI